MTTFGDVLQSGSQALTSAQSSIAPTMLCRRFDFTGGVNSTQTAVLPVGSEMLDATLYITQAGSAATTDAVSVSAGAVGIFRFSSIGSAAGILRQTTTGLGAFAATASAAAGPLSLVAETTISISCSSLSQDVVPTYTLEVLFNITRKGFN